MEKIALIILVSVLATQASRLLPPLALSRYQVSPRFEMWLRHIPVAIMAAIIVPDFVVKGPAGLVLNLQFFVAGLAALGVGLKTRNLVLTTLVGVLSVALLRL